MLIQRYHKENKKTSIDWKILAAHVVAKGLRISKALLLANKTDDPWEISTRF